jgi:hypothetical protein
MSFDGLAAKRDFIVRLLVSFMHGVKNTVEVVGPIHATKSLRSQPVLGSNVSTAGKCLFDVGLFHHTPVHRDLYRFYAPASDLMVLKFCSASTLSQVYNFLWRKQPHAIIGTSISIFFLHMFLTAWNSNEITCTTGITMFSSSLMWFNSMEGIIKITLHNLTASALQASFFVHRRVLPRCLFVPPSPWNINSEWGNLSSTNLQQGVVVKESEL